MSKEIFLPCMAGLVLLILLLVLGRRIRRKKRYYSLAYIDRLEGVAFERYVAEILPLCGYDNIRTTPASRDFGVDILADKDGESTAFQCKRYASAVGLSAIQEVFTGMAFYDTDRAVVVSNARFTDNARLLADTVGVELWDRDTLSELLTQLDGQYRRMI